MFENIDFLLELEIVLHEKEDNELLDYMNENLQYVILRMNKVKLDFQKTAEYQNFLQEDFIRVNYLYYTFIELWVSRN